MAEKVKVEMEDGSKLEFGAKQKLIKVSNTVEGVTTCQLNFVNGAQRVFTVPSEEMLIRLATHGMEQKLGDEIAGIKEIDDCVLSIESLIDRLEKGEWAKARTSNGMAGTSVLIQALVEHAGKEVSAIKTFLKDKTQAQKLALRNNPAIKVIVEKIEAERLAAKVEKNPDSVVDTDALLAEI